MDQTNLILGTFQFRFHATLPATNANLPASYTASNFGEVLNGLLKPAATVKEAWDSVGGVLGLIKIINTKRRLDFEGDLQKIDPAIVLPYYLGSASGAAPAPGKVTDGFGYLAIQAEGEPVTGAGNAILAWYGFPCGVYVDGELKANAEDYSTLKLHVIAYLARGTGNWVAGTRPIT